MLKQAFTAPALAAAALALGACRTPAPPTAASLVSEDGEPGQPPQLDPALTAAMAEHAPAAKDCAAALNAAGALVAGSGRVDWTPALDTAATQAFTTCLGHYVRLRTVNPPGDEHLAVAYLKLVFDELGIPSRPYATDGRWNLVATLAWRGDAVATGFDWAEPSPSKAAVTMYHHTDVVPVIPEQWVDPALTFAGTIGTHPAESNGARYVWGRGAIDMKSYATMQLVTLALLKAADAPLARDLHFVASADEEVAAKGARGLLHEMRAGGPLAALRRTEVLLNEGGYGLRRAGKNVHLIATEEKGGAWLVLRHPSAGKLINGLHAVMSLVEPTSSWKRQSPGAPGCEMTRYETPGAQVNVVPSIGALRITCAGGVGSLTADGVKKAFVHAYKNVEGLRIDVAPSEGDAAGPGFDVRVELASSGHGSLGGLSALQVAAAGLYGLRMLDLDPWSPSKPAFYKYQNTAGVDAFVKTLVGLYYVPGILVNWTNHVPLLEQKVLKQIGSAAYSERLFRTACSWTSLDYEKGSTAEAMVDCRLVHTGAVTPEPKSHGEHFVSELRQRNQDPQLEFALTQGWNYGASSITSPDFKHLVAAIEAHDDDSKVSAFLAPTSSDSTWFRAPVTAGSDLGPIPSYGFFPAILAEDIAGTIHGSNERMPLAKIERALRIYTTAVARLGGKAAQ